MRIRIDFQLNRQFNVVEKIIFRLVLNGFKDSREIAELLLVFSDSVVANGIKHLVNRQILVADIEGRKLSLSEPLVAIINMCLKNTYEINVPTKLEGSIKGGGVIISGIDKESFSLKQAILYQLIPGVKLDMYVDSLDFVLYEERGNWHG